MKKQPYIRDLYDSDFESFVETLSSLRRVTFRDKEQFAFHCLHTYNPIRKTRVWIYNGLLKEMVFGTYTIILEDKFIHDCGRVAHIEDVAVREGYHGYGIGKALMDDAIDIASRAGAYKLILNCSPNLVRFYEKCGLYQTPNVQMRLDFKKRS